MLLGSFRIKTLADHESAEVHGQGSQSSLPSNLNPTSKSQDLKTFDERSCSDSLHQAQQMGGHASFMAWSRHLAPRTKVTGSAAHTEMVPSTMRAPS